jgi:hypothetical protein
MNDTEITIEFKWPWTMVPLELADEWIEEVKKGLSKRDPLFGKDIFVSGRKENDNLLLVDNDTDDTYAIVRLARGMGERRLKCSTIEIFETRIDLAKKLKQDHIAAVRDSTDHG